MTYTLEQARTNLAQLLAEAEQGREVVIEREGQPSGFSPSAIGQLSPCRAIFSNAQPGYYFYGYGTLLFG